MSAPTRVEILKLYKNLLRYGEQLKFTNKDYFTRRIRKEFQSNKDLTDESAINLRFEVSLLYVKEFNWV